MEPGESPDLGEGGGLALSVLLLRGYFYSREYCSPSPLSLNISEIIFGKRILPE